MQLFIWIELRINQSKFQMVVEIGQRVSSNFKNTVSDQLTKIEYSNKET